MPYRESYWRQVAPKGVTKIGGSPRYRQVIPLGFLAALGSWFVMWQRPALSGQRDDLSIARAQVEIGLAPLGATWSPQAPSHRQVIPPGFHTYSNAASEADPYLVRTNVTARNAYFVSVTPGRVSAELVGVSARIRHRSSPRTVPIDVHV